MTSVLLVQPPTFGPGFDYKVNLGPAIIATRLRNYADSDVSIYDMNQFIGSRLHKEDMKTAYLKSLKILRQEVSESGYVGFVTMTYTFPIIKKILMTLKEDLGELPTIVAGGIHPSFEYQPSPPLPLRRNQEPIRPRPHY